MRSAAMIEELEEDAIEGAEFSLGMGSLIGIFFGLALVCGVFFGFGYTLGHHGPGASVPSESFSESPQPAAMPVAPKPSAQVTTQPADASRVIVAESAPNGLATVEDPAPSSLAPVSSSPAKSAASVPAKEMSAAKPQVMKPAINAPAPPAIQSAASQTPGIMVQIAAVRSRPDAEALAAALQRNGFSPTIRAEAQDKLLHVQVGPFSNRDEAKAMRQKLSSSGYNAFIK